MATSPITIVWASTTSNITTISPTAQGNGIVFESDVVSNFINTALYINSQATRNLQVMGGYYDAGQDYKNYQYCSQLSYVGNEYVLNFYMATQDAPTLAPTNATTFQQNTTDMQVPINPTSVQAGWKQISFIPNQANIAFVNNDNAFTGSNTFEGTSTFTGDTTLNATTIIGNLKVGGILFPASSSTYGSLSFSNSGVVISNLSTLGVNISSSEANSPTIQIGTSQSVKYKCANIKINNTASSVAFYTYDVSSTGSGTYARVCGLQWENTSPYFSNAVEFGDYGGNGYMKFSRYTLIRNASISPSSYMLDPEWEQDYATANYVNQKTLDLYDEIDARLSAIEEKLGIPKVASRGVDIKTRLASMEVAKSPITELFEKINNMQGYEGVLAQSNTEERRELSQARNDETEVMKIVNSIKDRIEREAKEREEAEAQSQKEQTQESSSKTRTRKKS